MTTSDAEREAINMFLEDIDGYLTDDDGRSHWGIYSSEVSGWSNNSLYVV